MLLKFLGLESATKSEAYKHRLAQGWQLVLSWLTLHTIDFDTWTDDLARANLILVNFVQDMFNSRKPIWIVRHAILSAQTHWFHLRHHIPRPWDAIRSWQLTIKKGNRVPCPLILVRAIFGLGLSVALECKNLGRFILPLIVLVRLGFWCMLRPGEIVLLTVGDVLFHNDVAVIAIRNPKNKRFFGRSQFVVLRDVQTVAWLRWLCSGLPSSIKLFPSNAAVFRQFFKLMLDKLGAAHLGLTPASLRPGGCTHSFLEGVSIGQIRFMGRWASDNSLNCYIQEAMSILVIAQMSAQLHEYIVAIAAQSDFAWQQPPSVSWLYIFVRRSQWRPFKKANSSWPQTFQVSPRMRTRSCKARPDSR